MKKINFTWNNTDWSVSKSEIAAQSEQHRNRNMKTKESINAENKRFLRSFPQFAEQEETAEDNVPAHLLERARQEAAALAWSTDFPFLLLPCLTEELENDAKRYSEKQKRVRELSAPLFPVTFPVASQRLAA